MKVSNTDVWSNPSALLRFSTFMDSVLGMDEPSGGWGALVAAIDEGLLDEVLNTGSPVTSSRGEAVPTLLWCCCLYASPEVVAALLARGADPNVWTGRPAPEATEKLLPLSVASSRGNAEIVRLLLDAGATMVEEETLVAACEGGHRDVFELLVSRGARVDRTLSFEGITLLDHCVGPYGTSAATRAGITDRIRTMLAEKSAEGPPLLECVGRPRKIEGLSAFIRPRIDHELSLSWIVLAVERPLDAVTAAMATEGTRVERDAAGRAVAGPEGLALMRLGGVPWTWVLLEAEMRGADYGSGRWSGRGEELARRLSKDLRTRVACVVGLETSEWSSGRRVAGDEAEARSKRRALAVVRTFAGRLGLSLPHVQLTSTGQWLRFRVYATSARAIERIDVLVTE